MAGLRSKIPELVQHILDNNKYFETNEVLFNIYEGNLLKYIDAALKKQLTKSSYEQISHRIAPINVLIRIIDKLSKIYQQEPVREIIDGTENDTVMLRWYEQQFYGNQKWNISNEFFNLFKNNLLQPFVDRGTPRMRPIPSDRFIPWSDNPRDPTIPTVMLVKHGTIKSMNADEGSIDVWGAFSEDEFLLFNMKGEIVPDMTATEDQMVGVNPISRIPFTYINRSHNLLIPKQDTDTIAMTLLIPVLLSDMNLISMFQAFSIVYGINVDDKGIVFAPNAFWSFEEKGDGEKKAEIGTIKPEADIESLIRSAQTQLAMWLQSRGIKPGAMGRLDKENIASGVSKIIDEMDTSEERKKQVEFYQNAELDFWDMIMHHMHPYWIQDGQIKPMPLFSQNAKVRVNYAEQAPALSRAAVIAESKEEVEAGFTTRRRAISKLNPKMTEKEVDDLMKEIEEERTTIIEEEETVPADDGNDAKSNT